MNVEHLREFAVFSKHLNFTSAAKELFLAQSTLSTHIAQLEDELGFALVNRKGGNRLTARGAVFLQGAQGALDALENAIESCNLIQSEEATLRIVCSCPPLAFVSSLRDRLDCPFAFVEYDFRSPLFAKLLDGEADVLLTYDYSPFWLPTREAERSGIATKVVPSTRMCVSMMAGNPLAGKADLGREDLRGAQIVITDPYSYDYCKALIADTLGENLGLSFKLDPIASMSDLMFFDFGEALHVNDFEESYRWLDQRSDVVVFDKVDGEPLFMNTAVAYRKDARDLVIDSIDTVCECLLEQARLPRRLERV